MNQNQKNIFTLLIAALFVFQSAGFSFAAAPLTGGSSYVPEVSTEKKDENQDKKDENKDKKDKKDKKDHKDENKDASATFLSGETVSTSDKKDENKDKKDDKNNTQDEHKIKVDQPVVTNVSSTTASLSVHVEGDNGQPMVKGNTVVIKYGPEGTDPSTFKSQKMSKDTATDFDVNLTQLTPGTNYVCFVEIVGKDKSILKTSAQTDFSTGV